jgi:hypothetical protein
MRFADQIRFVSRSRFFIEDLCVSPTDFASRDLLQRRNLSINVQLDSRPLWFSVP